MARLATYKRGSDALSSDRLCSRCGAEPAYLSHVWGPACCQADYRERNGIEVVERACAECGTTFSTTDRRKRFCDRDCKEADREHKRVARLLAAKPDRACVHCGTMLDKTKRADARYCSEACNQSAHNQTRKASAKIGARQARIDRAYIISRDGSRCHLCKRVVPAELVTLDHLVPLSLGGAHVAENLAVACLPCNTRKGARAANDQLLLIG